MGLNDLSKKDVENVFSYTLSKYDSIDNFLDKFKNVLGKLYEYKNYKGGWNEDKINTLLYDYGKRTDSIKKDFRDKKIVHLTGSSVTVVGGILSYTPLAPVGWGLLGIGGSMNAITDVVDIADKRKQNAWKQAKENLQAYVENPFNGTAFEDIYRSLIETYLSVKNNISNSDYTVILQGLGWNYFLFRSQGKNHEEAVMVLKDVLKLFKTHRYTISTELKNRNPDAIKNIQEQVSTSCSELLVKIGTLGIIGLSAGIGIGATLAGINIASLAFRHAESIAVFLLGIGNGAMRFLSFMQKSAPAIAIVGGIASIVMDSIAIHNIDKTFEPYYAFKDECRDLFDKYKDEYKKTDVAICGMYKFINESMEEKER